MSDIVQRLRWTLTADTPARYPDIVNAAADEIERLRDEIERLRDTLRDVHDDLEASYPWAYTLDKTTIADFQKSGEKINDKVFKALYPDFKEAVA